MLRRGLLKLPLAALENKIHFSAVSLQPLNIT